ncbi:MAG: iron-containing alcohol dehydrogenase [Erysipelotrichaceae bacterium]|nr:iron-containing alcohol dehydrogenase [Erysipelotrichaceae bacterium]
MLEHLMYRAVQKSLYLVSFLIPWKFPQVIKTYDAPHELVSLLKKHQVKSILMVSDQSLVKLHLIDPFISLCEQHTITVVLYDKVVPNPTLDNVEEGYALALKHNVEWLVAIGGGSVMDAAKAIGVKMVRKTPLKKLKGILKVIKPIPPLVCIPTTAGTGSETTVASVLSDPFSKEKFAISDPALFPHTAILDPTLLQSLPPFILASTGMDALTHGIESYLNQNHTQQSKQDALESMDIIFKHLLKAYQEQSLFDKEQMLWASFLAGRSFTRAYVGYVHGLAHQLGAYYHVPHGVANAMLLPHVLRAYGSTIHSHLAFLYVSFIDSSTTLDQSSQAQAFIEHIEDMNEKMNIPKDVESLNDEDIDAIVSHALQEVHPTYPVPRFMNAKELKSILLKLKKK